MSCRVVFGIGVADGAVRCGLDADRLGGIRSPGVDDNDVDANADVTTRSPHQQVQVQGRRSVGPPYGTGTCRFWCHIHPIPSHPWISSLLGLERTVQRAQGREEAFCLGGEWGATAQKHPSRRPVDWQEEPESPWGKRIQGSGLQLPHAHRAGPAKMVLLWACCSAAGPALGLCSVLQRLTRLGNAYDVGAICPQRTCPAPQRDKVLSTSHPPAPAVRLLLQEP